MIEAQIVDSKKNRRRITCEKCKIISYTAGEYSLLYEAGKLVYFKFDDPFFKKRVSLCQECFFSQLKKISSKSNRELNVKVFAKEEMIFLQVNGNDVSSHDGSEEDDFMF